ncbi:MAG: acyltransferase domain-containing protein [Polyangiaceae bacterium]
MTRSTGRLAVIAAGQGTRPSRAQLELALSTPAGHALLSIAARAANLPGAASFLERGGALLDSTRVAQPALVALSLALARECTRGAAPDFVAGHSLGEITAVCLAHGLNDDQAIVAAAARGAAMEAASIAERGGLYAIRPSELGHALELGGGAAYLALDNTPSELVIGAPEGALGRIARQIPGRRLQVAGAFHGPSMQSGARALERALADVPSSPDDRLAVPFVSAVDVEVVTSIAAARDRLVRGVTAAVRFREVLALLCARDVRAFIIVGPGAALRAMVRASAPAGTTVVTTETSRELELARSLMEGAVDHEA